MKLNIMKVQERRGEEKEGLNKRRSKKIGEYWEEGETKTRFKKLILLKKPMSTVNSDEK